MSFSKYSVKGYRKPVPMEHLLIKWKVEKLKRKIPDWLNVMCNETLLLNPISLKTTALNYISNRGMLYNAEYCDEFRSSFGEVDIKHFGLENIIYINVTVYLVSITNELVNGRRQYNLNCSREYNNADFAFCEECSIYGLAAMIDEWPAAEMYCHTFQFYYSDVEMLLKRESAVSLDLIETLAINLFTCPLCDVDYEFKSATYDSTLKQGGCLYTFIKENENYPIENVLQSIEKFI